jgi:hypothetical protein
MEKERTKIQYVEISIKKETLEELVKFFNRGLSSGSILEGDEISINIHRSKEIVLKFKIV